MSEKRCTRYEQLSLLYQAFWLAMCWVVPSLLYVLLAQCQGACGACDWSFESGLALEQVGQDYWRLLGARMAQRVLVDLLSAEATGSTTDEAAISLRGIGTI
jgi:hypothetical protein